MKSAITTLPSWGQRAFLTWLEEARSKIQVPIRVEKQTRGDVEFSFGGIPTILRGRTSFRRYAMPPNRRRRVPAQKVSFGEMYIWVTWQHETWDLLRDWDAFPLKTENGYVCDQCPVENRQTFPDLDAIWKDHLFEPLLQWINEDLASACAIGIYQLRHDDGARWAKLLRQGNDREADYRIAKIEIER